MDKKELNLIYKALDAKLEAVLLSLRQTEQPFACRAGYFNGRLSKDECGKYQKEFFPLPLIEVIGFCSIEIDFDSFCVITKLFRKDALSFDYKKLDKYQFEAYGGTNLLNDFYVAGNSYRELKENIEKSDEKEIGFAFTFPAETEVQTICDFLIFLRRQLFYY